MNISGKTKVCGLIGDPAEHSLSPVIQNTAFRHLDLDYVYVVFTVGRGSLEDAILGVRGLGIRGLNVTMPHKIDIIKYLDELDETARSISSVNTILNKDERLIGYTTDGIGALNALRHKQVNPSCKIVMLGAGGASRSISFTLAKQASELVILNRTLEKAKKLANDLSSLLGECGKVRAAGLSPSVLKKELKDAHVLVNATSVGMHPHNMETPVDPSLLRPDLVVFDLVYEPLETRLLSDARRLGAKAIDGLSMLVHQGAASFEIWTGMKAPIEVMMKAAIGELERRKP